MPAPSNQSNTAAEDGSKVDNANYVHAPKIAHPIILPRPYRRRKHALVGVKVWSQHTRMCTTETKGPAGQILLIQVLLFIVLFARKL